VWEARGEFLGFNTIVCVCCAVLGWWVVVDPKSNALTKQQSIAYVLARYLKTVWNRNSLPFNFVCPNAAAAASYGFSLSKTLTW
jgi:hypothetical protein